MTPHKHCEVIKAWADGYVIQWRQPPRQWIDLKTTPGWNDKDEYRVKPEKKTIGQLFYEVWYKRSLSKHPNLWIDCAHKEEWEERALDFIAALKENNHVI